MRPALVLFSHGSLLCGSGRLLDAHVSRLRLKGQYCAVEPGYLNYVTPTIETAVERCANAGALTIIIVPYFLVTGKFVTEDLPQRLEKVISLYPQLKFKVAGALEDEPSMLTAVDQVTAAAIDPAVWQRRAVEAAKQRCEVRADCPLYKSPLCRASI